MPKDHYLNILFCLAVFVHQKGRTNTWLKVVRIHFNWLSLATMNTGIGTLPTYAPSLPSTAFPVDDFHK
jgi:hypothetical protein